MSHLKLENEKLASEADDLKLALDFEKSLNEEKETQIKDLQNQIQKQKQDRLESNHEIK